MLLFAHVFMIFCFFYLLSVMGISKNAFLVSEFVFAFNIPFIFSEFMKALVLVEHLSKTGF